MQYAARDDPNICCPGRTVDADDCGCKCDRLARGGDYGLSRVVVTIDHGVALIYNLRHIRYGA